MELFIQVDENGQAKEHPIHGDNFRQAFPHIDTNNLPSNFARFERVALSTPGPYEKNHRVSYQKRPDGAPATSRGIFNLTTQMRYKQLGIWS